MSDNKLKIGLILNTGFTIFEFIIGVASGSLALISDSGHNLTDSLSILIAYFAQKIGKREANYSNSYGYGRATILAALFNGIIVVLLALFVFYEAFLKIIHPEPVAGILVMAVAFVGIIINGSIAFIYRKNTDDLNIRSVYVNIFHDVLASIGALIAGLLIVITKEPIFDSIISIVIGILLLKGSWEIINETLHILLEGVPEGMEPKKVIEAIKSISKITNVDDLHIWTISSKETALSCHIIVKDCDVATLVKVTDEIKKMLAERFNITHATIEPELTECLTKENVD